MAHRRILDQYINDQPSLSLGPTLQKQPTEPRTKRSWLCEETFWEEASLKRGTRGYPEFGGKSIRGWAHVQVGQTSSYNCRYTTRKLMWPFWDRGSSRDYIRRGNILRDNPAKIDKGDLICGSWDGESGEQKHKNTTAIASCYDKYIFKGTRTR